MNVNGDHEQASGTAPAEFSADRLYRYVLRRQVGLTGGNCTFIMLNPSTADEKRNDSTIQRVQDFASRWGFSKLNVVNLFAFRTPDPKLLQLAREPVGEENDGHIWSSARWADLVVCAWGVQGTFRRRSSIVVGELASFREKLHCLGRVGNGEPIHPLYVPKDRRLAPVEAEGHSCDFPICVNHGLAARAKQ